MSLKTISLISLIILALVFVVYLVHLCFISRPDDLYIISLEPEDTTYTLFQVVETLLWLPFIMFFWKIYKG